MAFKRTSSRYRIGRIILYIYAFTCFFQAQILKLSFGGMSIALNRVLLCIFLLDFIIAYLPNKNRLSYFKGKYNKFLIFWICWQAITVCFSLLNGMSGWIKLTWWILVFIGSSFVLSKYITSFDKFYKFIILLQLGMLTQAIIGIYEHLTGIYLFAGNKEEIMAGSYLRYMRWPVAMQTNPNDFAVLMFFAILISMVLLKIHKSKIVKIVCVLTILLSGYLIVVADARAVLLAGLISCVYYVMPYLTGRKKMKAITLGKIIVGFAAAICFFFANGIDFNLQESLSFSMSGGSETARMNLIFEGLKNAVKTLGIGTGSHSISYHNLLVEILADCGLAVLIGFVYVFWDMYRRLKRICFVCKDKNIVMVAEILKAGFWGTVVITIAPASCLSIEWFSLVIGIYFVFCDLAKNALAVGVDN